MCRQRHAYRIAGLTCVVGWCGLGVTSGVQAESPPPPQVTPLASRVVDVSFSAQSAGGVVSRVELWYTRDGQTWRLYSQSHDPQPPIRFRAAEDGVHGFFVLLANAHGASSRPPGPGAAPHHWVLIDTTRPLLQVKQVEVLSATHADQPLLMIAWTAHDQNLPERPISIYYQLAHSPGWQLLASNLTNLGRFDWPLPQAIVGDLQIRVEAVDRSGNKAADVSDTVVVSARNEPQSVPPAEPVGQGAPPLSKSVEADAAPVSTAQPAPAVVDEASRLQAHDLYERGIWRRQRGELDLATQRLIEAMNLDPTMAAPAFELAELYYTEGQFEPALDIYNTILQQRQGDREALRGMALAQVALKDYPEALAALERLLLQDPEDAQTWLDAGDVFIWMGQRQQARRHWRKARDTAGLGSQVRHSAERKLRRFTAAAGE